MPGLFRPSPRTSTLSDGSPRRRGAPLRRHYDSRPEPVIVTEAAERVFPLRGSIRERPELVGRDRDMTVIREFVAELPARGGTLLLSGEPGVGKSVLLNAAAEMAATAGIRVLRAAGAEFEDESFSGLNQLLLPLRGELSELDGPHRSALSAALGFGDGPARDRLVVSSAVLSLLSHVAADCPLLLIVDDLPWVDQASACRQCPLPRSGP
jgi:predicted ATPase